MSTTVERGTAEDADAALSEIAQAAIRGAVATRSKRYLMLDRLDRYRRGVAGIPDIPEGSSDEIKEIAALSPMGMCGVVVDTFVNGLSVEGYRSPDAKDDEPAWKKWQDNGLDARQREVHDGTTTYGWAFVSVLPQGPEDAAKSRVHTWSPKDVEAVYIDPRRDDFPSRATLFREVEGGWSVLIVDKTHVQSGTIKHKTGADGKRSRELGDVEDLSEPWEHGATYRGEPVCPVVRFVNELPTDDRDPRGEVEPIIVLERGMNSVNFDRLTASRFSVFNQKVVFGWAATQEQTLKASSTRVWAFEDHPADMSVQSLPASPITPYNELLREMKEQVALKASIPIYTATGSVANVSENTVAMVDNAYQLKLGAKRDLHGEAWERVLHLAVVMDGEEPPSESAEIIWRDTRPRSMGAVVDGISKLAAVDVPIAELLSLVPDFSQQRVDAIRDQMRRTAGLDQIEAIIAAGRAAPAAAPVDGAGTPAAAEPAGPSEAEKASTLKVQFEALGMAVRAGVDPEDAAKRVGLDGIKLTGLVPASLKRSDDEGAG